MDSRHQNLYVSWLWAMNLWRRLLRFIWHPNLFRTLKPESQDRNLHADLLLKCIQETSRKLTGNACREMPQWHQGICAMVCLSWWFFAIGMRWVQSVICRIGGEQHIKKHPYWMWHGYSTLRLTEYDVTRSWGTLRYSWEGSLAVGPSRLPYNAHESPVYSSYMV